MTTPLPKSGYAPINGLKLYHEIHGNGDPVVLLHGGLGMTGMFGELIPHLAATRQVVAVDLQAHGRTADIDRPLRSELMADDVAMLIETLGYETADIVGYSMGGAVALRVAIQHPSLVSKAVLISTAYRKESWYPEVRAAMGQMNREAAEFMKESPMYQSYTSIAPRPDDFPVLVEKMGELVRRDYDWSDEVASLGMPVMLVYGDADSIPPSEIATFFRLLGGGVRDAGWDGSGMSDARLAILPGATHYDILYSPLLLPAITPFLNNQGKGAVTP